ncbi:aminodeoxychorismate synthase component I [Aquamicrobium sp. LC103]|uniref:aminodeoxychorismate synthase component I n=1 Tax=Aquamicrobium sp. LC103 TaxID=1120658 RepID=UPI00063E6DE4|nr:aminodeoxychorismate synthase component I [Aquamicrobium sp. LC103]TKT77529.1 aminodeoxychorismate synthase component I [Aquamicrobium sp. LC103]
MVEAAAQRFVLFRNDREGREVLFSDPGDLIVAWEPDEFLPALQAAEEARRRGKWLAGYFSYEAGYLLEPKLRPILPEGRRAPLVCLGVFDRPTDLDTSMPSVALDSNSHLADPRATWSAEKYRRRFERLHWHIRAGDCYQANLTFPVHARWDGDPRAIFDAMTRHQPVRYAAFVNLAGPVVLSRSPELFFKVSEDRWIETLPMKGTAPRGKTPEEDEQLRSFLMNDPKNQAENRMIVDLLRNDISRISEVGTLDVPELFTVESYPTVHQMVSRVRARLLPGLSIADIFAALFPCGSITGAPKIRAMEILRELEETPRDVYCGAIGWIEPGGRMRFNVAIRTISLYPEGEAVYNVGGGIVFDSTADDEYAECLLKGRFATGNPPAST